MRGLRVWTKRARQAKQEKRAKLAKRRTQLAILAAALGFASWSVWGGANVGNVGGVGNVGAVATARETASNGERALAVVAKEPEKCAVLLVGVDKYKTLPSLQYASSDVRALRDALVDIGFPFKSIRTLVSDGDYNDRPSREAILAALDEILAASGPESTVLIALSGHGFETENGDAAFCPEDVEVKQVGEKPRVTSETAILIEEVATRLRKDDAKFKLLIVDACREPASTERSADAKARSFNPIPEPNGVAFLQSCESQELSWEHPELNGGVFSAFFAKGLRGAADSDGDGGVSFLDVCNYATSQTQRFVKDKRDAVQTPFYRFSGVVDFWLKPPTGKPRTGGGAGGSNGDGAGGGSGWLPLALLTLTGGMVGFAVWTERKRRQMAEALAAATSGANVSGVATGPANATQSAVATPEAPSVWRPSAGGSSWDDVAEDASRKAWEEAERRAESERRAREEAERKIREAERKAKEAEARAAAERKAREAAERADAERRAREEAERKVREAERKAQEAAARAESERKAREAAENERKAREAEERAASERRAREESERKIREAEEARAEAERKAREAAENERKAREEAERQAREAERKAQEAAVRAESERKAREAAENERKAREEAERKVREAERKAQEAAARAESERKAREAAENERKAREEAERKAREAERRAQEAAARAASERKAREAEERAESERKAREAEERAAAERRAREESERKAKEAEARAEAERKAREEAKRKTSVAARTSNGWSAEHKAGTRQTLQIKGVEYAFRYCPAGTFLMGSPKSEKDRLDDETQHRVTLTNGFWMLETPVTQAMWQATMGSNPSWFSSSGGGSSDVRGMDTSNFPVEHVSWNDCQEFVKKLNSQGLALDGFKFRLPSEAEWEYACRAGTTTSYFWGDSLNGDKANCNGNYPCGTRTKGQFLARTTKVGSYASNPWGLYDMHGNVWEWCEDLYDGYKNIKSFQNPINVTTGSARVVRGGSWNNSAAGCRSANRSNRDPTDRSDSDGFRLALVRSSSSR